MPETLLSILCSEPWRWDAFASSEIVFHPDGTGKLTCRAELNVWIAAETEWKARDAASLQQQVSLGRDGDDDASSLAAGPVEIELTLTKRRLRSAPHPDRAAINEDVLEEAGFRPKTYTLRLDRGAFHAQSHVPERGQPPQHTPRFRLRLTLDPSPYPPRQEWARPERAPDAMRFWEWTQFCSRRIGYY
ncbi:epoxide hydrolase [Cordyceps militaris]|uniref:Epoxide hydrolase n=1 Tax=Cordyceps militaris TaxID=73501 RepID=A0A2H4SJL0_CORMI|nr:epoxide hydrolase [Cordyceps militaris]